MFENYRGTEYGLESGPTLDDAILRSELFHIVESLCRADINEHWKRDAKVLLDELYPGWNLGTPLDHGFENLHKLRKLQLNSFKFLDAQYPTRRHSAGTLLNQLPADLMKMPMWRPRVRYKTHLARVTEALIVQSKADEMLTLLKDQTGSTDFDKAPERLKMKLATMIKRAEQRKGPFLVTQEGWLPYSEHPEQVEAEEYQVECYKYQASAAGKKAKRLLLENLRDDQIADYFGKGLFFVVPRQDEPLHERRIYVVERSFPNGNVYRVKKKRSRGGKWLWYPEHCYCFHTEIPHAVDDILLGQKLMLENEEFEFLKDANVTPPRGNGTYPLTAVKRSV